LHFNKCSRNTLLISRILGRGLKKAVFSTDLERKNFPGLVEFIKGKRIKKWPFTKLITAEVLYHVM